jgi:hypothetical protein
MGDRKPAAHFNTGIVATAIRIGTEVLTLPRPARHCHYLKGYNAACRKEGWDVPWEGWSAEQLRGCEQGFLNHLGQFVDRVEAARIAIEEKQIEGLNWGDQLYSEDLW